MNCPFNLPCGLTMRSSKRRPSVTHAACSADSAASMGATGAASLSLGVRLFYARHGERKPQQSRSSSMASGISILAPVALQSSSFGTLRLSRPVSRVNLGFPRCLLSFTRLEDSPAAPPSDRFAFSEWFAAPLPNSVARRLPTPISHPLRIWERHNPEGKQIGIARCSPAVVAFTRTA